MGKKIDKFLLLMWKNFLLQWRHPKQTIVEILAPVLFAMLLVVIRSLVSPEPHSARLFIYFTPRMVFVDRRQIIDIPWSPSTNPNLVTVMENTMNAMNSKGPVTEVRLVNCINSEELEKYWKDDANLGSIMAAIQFDDSLSGQTDLTSDLNVTIRFPAEQRDYNGRYHWKTNLLYPPYQMPGPRSWMINNGGDPHYNAEGFLYLQQHLSLSIINHFNEDFNRNSVMIEMERFSYPKWTEDPLLEALKSFVGLIIMLSFVYTCISTVKVITTEKEKQLKEAMKIMGLPGWLHWTAWFIKTFLFLLITIIIMVVLMKANWYPGSNYTVFTYSDPTVIFVFLLFFVCATITFCFAISVFFSKANTAATVAGLMWFLSYFPYSYMLQQYDTMSLSSKLLASLCSNTAMAYGFQLMLMFEGIEEGLQWHNIWKTTTSDDNLKLGHLMIVLLVDTVIYLLIALYVEAVFPGEYGVPQPWYFPFKLSYWCGKPVESETVKQEPLENEFYEKEPTHLQAGIRIRNLGKKFAKNKIAVDDLSLNMYSDQITVLLGHNGAGKTTTMSMLTGMFPPTSGTATVGGYDIRTDIAGVRDSLGLCPQHNILFDELTVKEHLYFYCRLKAVEKKQINAEISKFIELLELVPKANSRSSTLSGGMKRKLSVAVALCGGSSVVMCDEPTSGMDPAARRALWDLLQSQKKGRTILLTTHFMDEADLLGDRIAIMSEGKLQCCGSSFFLKKKYGAGYHLVMDKSPECDVDKVTNLLHKYIPNIEVENNIGSELTYVLNEEQSSIFEKMLSELETESTNLGVLTYGVSLTTMEEVFMKVGASHHSDEDIINKNALTNGYDNQGYQNDDAANNNEFDNGIENKFSEIKLDMEKTFLTGWSLWCNQFKAMVMKRSLSIIRSWILFLIQNGIPVLFIALTIFIIRNIAFFEDLPNLKIGLDSYNDPVTVITREDANNSYFKSYLRNLESTNQAFINWENRIMRWKMMDETKDNPSAVRLRYITGAHFGQNCVRAFFNNDPYHSPPLALHMVMNAILQAETSPEHSIILNHHPLPFTTKTKITRLAQGNNMGFQIAFNVGFSMAFVSSFYVMFYIKERVVKAKHLQFLSGVDVLSFWGSAFLCDMLTFIFTSLLVVLTLVIFQEDGFKTFDELGRFFSVLLYFGFCMIPMMYVSSYFFNIPSTGYTKMAFINIFTGVAAFLVVEVLSQPALDLQHIGNVLHWIFLLVPHYSLSTGLNGIYTTYSTNKLCDTVINACKWTMPLDVCKVQACKSYPICCGITQNYYGFKDPGIGTNIVFSCSVGVCLIAILLMIEYRIFENIRCKLSKRALSSPSSEEQLDDDVVKEKQKIKDFTIEDIKKHNLVMRDVTKYYKKFLAVNRISLAVNKYECFGLLGVNGAGKTTTFKMMTGDMKFSDGDAWINGLSLKTDTKEIYKLIGYCPQFDALLDDLTCRETIIIFGLLRGITMSECKLEAKRLAREFDFSIHLNKKVKELSGGNKRKLSTSIALIGDPLIIYLDEPTTGMDPATKRYLWNALCKVRNSGKCIVLTSHSMEECEALCTRLAIMVNGTFMCLGSAQHLKSKFSEGYTLIIKVRKTETSDEFENLNLVTIEEFVKDNFPGAIVREKHQELITFYIVDKSQPWSKMFGIMERGKESLHIEDYSLGQSSLEQVFLSFTKYQREE